MNDVWTLDLDTVIEILELAMAHGKKPGESIQEEFDEVMKKYPEKFKHLGATELNNEELKSQYEQTGLKILDLRKKGNDIQ